jgi:hypothetical protein
MREQLIRYKVHVGELYSKFAHVKTYNQSRDAHILNIIKQRCNSKTFNELQAQITKTRLNMDAILPSFDVD